MTYGNEETLIGSVLNYEEDENDIDSLHALPLSVIPLKTASLRRARLIKNIQLNGVVEIFSGDEVGSGQIEPAQLSKHYGWPEKPPHPDLVTVTRLAFLNSYDVYSLRIEMRRLNIPVNDIQALKLSEDKSRELASYMRSFTEPLIRQVYGATGDGDDVQNFDELVGMFKSPNRDEALKNLRLIAQKLRINLTEVPQFLEDYGDVFLSLAYFREQLDRLVPKIGEFLEIAKILQSNFQVRNDPRYMNSVQYMDQRLNSVVTSITGRFESFNQHTQDMWKDINADSFDRVRRLITSHHTTVGGVLCGLSVKMRLWDAKFGRKPPDSHAQSRAEFIMGEMRQGIDKIERIEQSAPKIKDF